MGSRARTGTDRRRFLRTVAAGAALTAAGGSLDGAAAPGRATPAQAEPGRATPAQTAPGPAVSGARARPPAVRPLFLGTYTSVAGGGTGVGLGTYDTARGRITATGVIDGVGDPAYLAFSPCGRTLYTVNERQQGAVTAVALRADGRHRVLGSRPTGGAGPCHLSVHPGGRWLLSANHLSGSVAVHPVDPARGGALGERTDLVTHTAPPPGPGQGGPHAHQIVTSPDGRHVLAVDLGNDTAVVCAYDPATGTLTPGAPQSTGTGPGTSYPAQFLMTRDGAFAYLANRGHNSLTRYAVEAAGARGGLRRLGEPFPAPVAVCVLPL
ncbi:lactonase family protein [Streptomyces chrestomyceticus]|uniref:lactonase family protein n=1 Tax=Streptomyces chrestomyceticus TaxID=68185 RepID=UPI003798A8C2